MTNETSRINLVVFGAAGLIGLVHVKAALATPDLNLVAFIDPTPAGTALGAKHDIPCFASYDDMMSAGIRIDAAIVATPNATHVPLGVMLLKAGIHCIIEKPVSIDTESGKLLLQAAAEGNAKLMVGHHRRFNPYLTAAKAAVETGNLGKLIAYSGIWATKKPLPYFDAEWRRQFKSGGPLLINMIHEVDAVRYVMMSEIVKVYVEVGPRTRGFEAEETVAVVFSMANGAVGTFVMTDVGTSPWTWEQATGESVHFPLAGQNIYHVIGTNGSLAVPELKRWHHDSHEGSGNWMKPLQADKPMRVDMHDPYTAQCEHFVRVIRGQEEPRCSGYDGLRAVQIIEAFFMSIDEQRPISIATI